METELADWNDQVEKLHSSYKWLLFFRVPKLRILNDLLIGYATQPSQDSDPQHLLNIVREIGFLFRNDSETRKALEPIVEVYTYHTLCTDLSLLFALLYHLCSLFLTVASCARA